MRRVVRNATVVVTEAGPDGLQAGPVLDQSVVIYKNGAQAIIGIDGHTSRWDDQVEVRWEGSHRRQLEHACRVEIREPGGEVVESLPMHSRRPPYERDGETVFFLADEE